MQIFNKKEQDGQSKVRSVQLEEKKNTRQGFVGVKSCDQREKVLQSLILEGLKGVLTSGQDPTWLIFQLVKVKKKKSFSGKGRH